MVRTDPYALHRPVTVDAHYAYCMEARAKLAELKAKRKPSLLARIRAAFR